MLALVTVGALVVTGGAGIAGVTGGCSSESTLVGDGACDAYCTKIVGAKCRGSLDKDACKKSCLSDQSYCATEENDFLRCANQNGTVNCNGGAVPSITGCDHYLPARDTACSYGRADAASHGDEVSF